jgi:hypothetical protein
MGTFLIPSSPVYTQHLPDNQPTDLQQNLIDTQSTCLLGASLLPGTQGIYLIVISSMSNPCVLSTQHLLNNPSPVYPVILETPFCLRNISWKPHQNLTEDSLIRKATFLHSDYRAEFSASTQQSTQDLFITLRLSPTIYPAPLMLPCV